MSQTVIRPTRKQIAYIRQLAQKLGYQIKVKDMPFTKKEAGETIERLLKQEGQDGSVENNSTEKFEIEREGEREKCR